MIKLRGSVFQAGFSLVELMVALTLGLPLTGGITALSVNSSHTNRSLNAAGQQPLRDREQCESERVE